MKPRLSSSLPNVESLTSIFSPQCLTSQYKDMSGNAEVYDAGQ